MRVVFIRSNPVNPDSRVEKEVVALLKSGKEVQVLAWDRDNDYRIRKEKKTSQGIQFDIWRVGIKSVYGGGMKRNFIPLLKFQIEIAKWLVVHRNEYDVIHACDFDTAYVSRKVVSILGKKLVYDIFDYYADSFKVPNKIKGFIIKADKRNIEKADAVILCTEKRIDQIVGRPRKLCIIHNSPFEIEQSSDVKIVGHRMKAVYVGILSEERMIIELMNVVSRNKDTMELHIAGFGQLENQVVEMAKSHDNIMFYGRIDYDKTLDLENQCDIMTAIYSPDNRNHFFAAPNKFYEALMLGKPVIMVEGTGMSEVVLQNGIGCVIEYTEKALEEALTNLYTHKDAWSEISDKGIELYKNDYAWKKMEERLVALYATIE